MTTVKLEKRTMLDVDVACFDTELTKRPSACHWFNTNITVKAIATPFWVDQTLVPRGPGRMK